MNFNTVELEVVGKEVNTHPVKQTARETEIQQIKQVINDFKIFIYDSLTGKVETGTAAAGWHDTGLLYVTSACPDWTELHPELCSPTTGQPDALCPY